MHSEKKPVEFAADVLLGLILFLKPIIILQKVSHNNTYTFKYTTSIWQAPLMDSTDNNLKKKFLHKNLKQYLIFLLIDRYQAAMADIIKTILFYSNSWRWRDFF